MYIMAKICVVLHDARSLSLYIYVTIHVMAIISLSVSAFCFCIFSLLNVFYIVCENFHSLYSCSQLQLTLTSFNPKPIYKRTFSKVDDFQHFHSFFLLLVFLVWMHLRSAPCFVIIIVYMCLLCTIQAEI